MLRWPFEPEYLRGFCLAFSLYRPDGQLKLFSAYYEGLGYKYIKPVFHSWDGWLEFVRETRV